MSRENVEIVHQMWAGLNEEGLPWLALCDESYEIRNPPAFPVRGPYIGHDGARQWATEVWEVFSDLHHELQEVIDVPEGETVVSVQRTTGHMRHTNLKVDVQWATVWSLRDGKALRAQGYMTRAEALEAAGLTE